MRHAIEKLACYSCILPGTLDHETAPQAQHATPHVALRSAPSHSLVWGHVLEAPTVQAIDGISAPATWPRRMMMRGIVTM
jgi:hypothetical protein